MKKLLTTIGLIFTLMTIVMPIASARMGLPDELHPDYAPVVKLQATKDGGPADEAAYGNYFLQLIAGGLLYFAAPVAVLVIAIGGLRYVTSHGKQENIEGAKKTLEWAIIGLIIIMLSFAIVRVIITTLLQTPTDPQKITPPASSTSTATGSTAAAGSTGNKGGTNAEPDNATPQSKTTVGGRGPAE